MIENYGAVAPIQIDHAERLLATTIERCPRTMLIRDLMMNAIEAASKRQRESAALRSKLKSSTAFPSSRFGIPARHERRFAFQHVRSRFYR